MDHGSLCWQFICSLKIVTLMANSQTDVNSLQLSFFDVVPGRNSVNIYWNHLLIQLFICMFNKYLLNV